VAVGAETPRDVRDPADGRRERRNAVGQPARSDVDVERRELDPVAAGGREGLVQAILVDAELRRPGAAVGELVVVAGAGRRVDPDPEGSRPRLVRAPRREPPSDPFELADRVEVQVERMGQDDVEIALGDVRAGVADLLGRPAALERAEDLARRAGVDPDQAAEGRQDLRIGVCLEREADAVAKPRPVQRPRQALGVLDEAAPVIDEQRRPVLARQRLGVMSGDREPAVEDLEARPDPPWLAGDLGDRAGGGGQGQRGHGATPGAGRTRRRQALAASEWGCGWAWRSLRGVRPGPGFQRSGPSSTLAPRSSSRRREIAATSAIAESNASLFRADGVR